MSLVIRTTGLEDYLDGGNGKLKLLIAGTSGVGKTRTAGFAPRPIFADCEGGLMSVADLNVPYASITSEGDMDAFLTLLEQECRKPEAQRRWETVVIDTLDRYQRHVIQGYLRRKRKAEMSGWEDWSHLDTIMTSFVQRLFVLPMHVLVLAHVKKDDDGAKALALKGAQRESLPGEFDFVGLMETEFGLVDGKRDIERFIRWQPTPDCDWLKARGGGLQNTRITDSATAFEAIREGIDSQIKSLTASQVIQTVEVAEERIDPAVAPVAPGGPVGNGTARKAAAPPPAAPAPTPAPVAAPAAAPRPTAATPPAAPPAAAQKPAPAPVAAPVPAEEAIGHVQETLGGKVIEDTANPTPEPATEAQTPVAESMPEPAAEQAAETSADPEPTKGVPNEGAFTTTCGAPRYTNSAPKEGIGCGQPMTVQLSAGRVVGAEDGQMADLIEIGGLSKQAFLHNACFNKARKA